MDELTDPAFERQNSAYLRWSLTIYCVLLPGCPGEHHPDCPRYPPRWATTDPRNPATWPQPATTQRAGHDGT